MTNNKSVLAWLDEMKELVTPDAVSYTHLTLPTIA